ncbi:MAG: cobalamin-binding protein [Longimicrobiales bacterium]
MRAVSMLASATEIVCALGLRDTLVGRSHECDYPPDILELPQVSRPSFPVTGSSKAVDLAVKDRLRKALSIYEVDATALQSLAPDVILTQTQCEVCAVSPADVERAAAETTCTPSTVVALEPNQLSDIWNDIEVVAAALQAEAAGTALIARLRGRLDEIESQYRGIASRPTVVTIEWIDPLMTAGNWMPELIELAGGQNLLGVAGKHSPWMTWDELVAADPDVLLVSPCGFGIERTMEEMHLLTAHPQWTSLKAVAQGRVFVADGNAYFHRPGPRVVESAEMIAEMLHGHVGARTHEGTGFKRYVSL